jgi:DnaJ-class molecular chaperone
MQPCPACNGTGRARLVDVGASGIEYLFRDNCLICHGKAFING